MKLVISIVQDEDAGEVIDSLTDEGFRVTKLSTTGGFLKSGNTTLMAGVEDEKVEHVLSIIKQICKKRKEILIQPTTLSGSESGYIQQYPVEVNVGGATAFVIDVEQFIKI